MDDGGQVAGAFAKGACAQPTQCQNVKTVAAAATTKNITITQPLMFGGIGGNSRWDD